MFFIKNEDLRNIINFLNSAPAPAQSLAKPSTSSSRG